MTTTQPSPVDDRLEERDVVCLQRDGPVEEKFGDYDSWSHEFRSSRIAGAPGVQQVNERKILRRPHLPILNHHSPDYSIAVTTSAKSVTLGTLTPSCP